MANGMMRAFAATGAWLCAGAVALAAYASHASDGLPQARLQTDRKGVV